VLLLGDFNVGPGYVDAAWKRIVGGDGLRDSVDVAQGDPHMVTWDPQNPLVKYGGYPGEPAARIDHILVKDGGGGRWTVRSTRVLMKEPVPGLVFTPRGASAAVEVPLSDHYAFAADLDLSPE